MMQHIRLFDSKLSKQLGGKEGQADREMERDRQTELADRAGEESKRKSSQMLS